MRHDLKVLIGTVAAGLTLALSTSVFAQTGTQDTVKAQTEKPSETAKTSKTAPTKTLPADKASKPDVLDELFKKAQDEVNNGQHCGPKPDVKQTPIA